MASQKDAGTSATGYVTPSQLPGPRACGHCRHYEGGNCSGKHVMADPELKARRNKDGTVKVEFAGYCWYFDPK